MPTLGRERATDPGPTGAAADEHETGPTRDRSTAAVSSRAQTGFWLVSAVYALAMLGGTLPIPLYEFWAPQFGFGAFTTTLIFATYAMGTVFALIVFGSMSDRVGRRPLLGAALIVAAASTVLFLLAGNVELLLAARLLSGLATGVVTATATAALGEFDTGYAANRTSMVATAANMGGLGLGALISGLFAQFGSSPTHLVFWAYLVGLVPALGAVAMSPETVRDRQHLTVAIRRPTVPAEPAARDEFLRAAIGIFAAFAVSGLFSSLVPSFLREQLHVRSVAVVGCVVGLLLLVAMLAQLVVPAQWQARWWVAPSALAGGVIVFEAGLLIRSLPVFLAGTLMAGAGIGLAFRHGIAVIQRLADPARRADLTATYFLSAFAGTIIPTLALGVLDQTINQNIATLVLAVAVVALTAAGARPHRSAPAAGSADS